MSYKKIAGTPNVIRFYYGIDDIFNKVSRKSSFKAASVLKTDGTADFDRVQLSDDNEKTLAKDYMKEGLLEIFSIMFKIISGDKINHDAAYDTGTGSIQASYADITDNAKYREINLDLIDTKIENAIVDFILFKWYALKGFQDDATLHFNEFKGYLAQISEKSLALRQP